MKFSGHESFNCRHLWLKKGIDFIKNGNQFTDSDAVVKLGVGKNMVPAINYWLIAFGLIDENKEITKFGKFIFSDECNDPYLENPATIWLLQYFLIKTNFASIYNLFFNELRKLSIEFSEEMLFRNILAKCEQNNYNVNHATLERDIKTFLKNYLRPSRKEKMIEDEYSGIFIENNILVRKTIKESSNLWYKTIVNSRTEIPNNVLLFAILDKMDNDLTISFSEIYSGINSPGNAFLITEDGLYTKLEEIQKVYNGFVFTDDAGIKEIQIKKNFDKWKVLRELYEN